MQGLKRGKGVWKGFEHQRSTILISPPSQPRDTPNLSLATDIDITISRIAWPGPLSSRSVPSMPVTAQTPQSKGLVCLLLFWDVLDNSRCAGNADGGSSSWAGDPACDPGCAAVLVFPRIPGRRGSS